MASPGRKRKDIEEMNKQLGIPDLRTYWRQLNRMDRADKHELRAHRKAKDQKRAKCRCAAFPFPHRPGSGGCRWPDPPVAVWKPQPDKTRRYSERYTGLRRKLCVASGLHPVRDRMLISELMPEVKRLAKDLKGKAPKLKYRNMTISAAEPQTRPDGTTYYHIKLTGLWTTAGPTM